jgi:cytoskeletal protein RodZ
MSSESEKTVSTGKGDGRKKLIVFIIVAMFLVLIGSVAVMASLLIKSNKSREQILAQQENQKEPKKVITPDTAEEVMEEILSEDTASDAPSSYTVTQNGVWTFENGDAETQDAYVANDVENETPIYFDLIVDETGETIYSSPVLELGAKLEKFRLDKHLDKGSYDCTVLYHLVDENQNTLTTTRIGVQVLVEN